jgi:hypothetical protein
MKRKIFAVAFFSFVAAAVVIIVGSHLAEFFFKHPVPVGQPSPAPQGEGWLNLLDAAHVAGWKNVSDAKEIHEIKDGIIHIFGRTLTPLRYVGYAAEKFGDFQLHVEFKVAPRANSGVFLRSQFNDPVYRGFEIQVLDDFGHAPDKNSCGSVYDIVTPMFNMSRPAGEWNSYDITLKGKDLVVVMNGWMVVHTDLAQMTTPIGKFKIAYNDLPLDGFIMLQDHGGETWYRNIFVRKLP